KKAGLLHDIGTVATKYAKGYGIRVAFGLAVVACMVSIIMKEFKLPNILPTVTILGAVGAICVYICGIMFKGAANELREKKLAEQKKAA
ncbi:MAG: hypothetical protein V2B18_19345, partial [Pseudomonadota bacterium]